MAQTQATRIIVTPDQLAITREWVWLQVKAYGWRVTQRTLPDGNTIFERVA